MSIISDVIGGSIEGTVTAIGDAVNKKTVIEADLNKTIIQADKEVALAQNEVNKVEAGSDDLYTKRWRPTLGYGCTIGFLYQFVFQPFIVLIAKLNHIEITMVQLDMTAIASVLTVLIGARSYDKYQQIKK